MRGANSSGDPAARIRSETAVQTSATAASGSPGLSTSPGNSRAYVESMLAKQDVSVCPPTGRTAPSLTEQSRRPPIATLLPADKGGHQIHAADVPQVVPSSHLSRSPIDVGDGPIGRAAAAAFSQATPTARLWIRVKGALRHESAAIRECDSAGRRSVAPATERRRPSRSDEPPGPARADGGHGKLPIGGH